jgi:hypothetical protein
VLREANLPGSQFGDKWPRLVQAALLAVSIGFSAALFLACDWLYTTVIVRKNLSRQMETCNVLDPVRTHALKASCTGMQRWGKDSYAFLTNDLGFRDNRVRVVPLQDPRPRIVLLGDSFTESKTSWRDSYAGQLAARFPQYEILNGGVSSYSPSNYLNVVRTLLNAHVQFDEVFVFVDMSDTQDEAAYYRDLDSSGAVGKPLREDWSHTMTRYHKLRAMVEHNFVLTNYIFGLLELSLVDHGWYYLSRDLPGNIFDQERTAWSYRKVSDTEPYIDGYGPLGVEGGIAKEKAKMTLLWQALTAHHVALNVVVYPWPGQIVHDTPDSRQVQIWRNWCSGKCRDFISLFPVFWAEKNQCPRSEPGCWYLRDFVFGDFHYNVAGNRLVADAVAESLLKAPAQKKYVPAAADQGAISGTPPRSD